MRFLKYHEKNAYIVNPLESQERRYSNNTFYRFWGFRELYQISTEFDSGPLYNYNNAYESKEYNSM